MNPKNYSMVNQLTFQSVFYLASILLIILPIKCDNNSPEWTRRNGRNVSEGYVSSRTPDYWRRRNFDDLSSKSVYKDTPYAFHTFVTIKDPSKNVRNVSSYNKQSFDSVSSNVQKQKKNAITIGDETIPMPKKKNYMSTDERSYLKSYRSFDDDSRDHHNKRHRMLEDKRSSIFSSETGKKFKVNTRRDDDETSRTFRTHDSNGKLRGNKQGVKSKDRIGRGKIFDSRKSKYFKNDHHFERRSKNIDNDFHASQRELHRRKMLDRSHFLPLFETRSTVNGGEEDEVKTELESDVGEFDVPPIHTLPKAAHLKWKRPNIVLVMTDDLDVELGSLQYMPRLLKRMGEEGALFSNAYTTTPMCCPSRSSMLTGMYIHNHEVYTNHQNCSSPLWQRTHERRSFASYLSNAGYNTAYIGKYLNRYNGSHVPSGWKEWAALLMNSRYYNYTINRNNVHVKYGHRYPHDYYPHVITNDGVKFLRSASKEEDPFLLVLSYPSPHGPEDSAPEHSHKFFNASDHHTASYNYAPNPDKQWMLQFTDRMPDIQLKYSDLLMTKRLQTLQSVDEAVEKIVNTIQEAGLDNNTYIFFTSDHGYHLGQFGLAKGKSMPFEFDVKVPFFVRGPGVKQGSYLPQIALNVDLAPTFLDIAGLPRPPQMDGRSLLPVLQSSSAPEDAKYVPWRDSFLIESSGRLREEEELEKKEIRTYEREKALSLTLLKATSSLEGSNSSLLNDNQHGSVSLYTSKHERLEEVCQRIEFSFPCQPDQKWHCVKIGYRWKIKKCRRNPTAVWQKHCICHFTQGFGTFKKLDGKEKRKQRNFLRKYVTKDFHSFDSKFIKAFNNINVPIQFGPRNSHPKLNRRRNGRKRFKRYSESYRKNITDNENEGFEISSDLQKTLLIDEDRHHPSPHFYLKELEENESIGEEEEEEEEDDEEDDEEEEKVMEDLKNEDENIQKEEYVPLTFDEVESSVHDFVEEEELRDIKDQIIDITDEIETLKSASGTENNNLTLNTTLAPESSNHGCKLNDGHIDCQDEVYANLSAWRDSKEAIVDQIHRLNQQLLVMKNILHHLQAKKPEKPDDLIDIYENEDYNEETDEDEEVFATGNESEDYDNEETDPRNEVATTNNEFHSSVTDIEHEEETTSDKRFESSVTGIEDPKKKTWKKLHTSKRRFKPDDLERNTESTSVEHSKPNKELNLPVVGLDIPLVEDVSHSVAKKERKHKNHHGRKHDHGRTNSQGRAYYIDLKSEDIKRNKVYYPVALPPFDNEVSGNDSLQSRLCWCDRRIIQKIAIQETRERKRQERQKIKEKRQMRKMRRKKKEKSVSCNYSTLNCYTHDNDHWRTPPLWTDGQFCFCINSANNTYWCLRTINTTHNFLYCEFITGLITYYDLHIDPYQLRNVAFTLSNERVLELNEKLNSLRSCKGADECDGWVTKEDEKQKSIAQNVSQTEFNLQESLINSEDEEEEEEEDDMDLKSYSKKRIKKLQERERRKKLRNERKRSKKLSKLNGYYGSLPENPFAMESETEDTVRIARKSRHRNERKLKKERKRQRRKRKKERKRLARMRKKRGDTNE